MSDWSITEANGGVTFAVRVVPRASRNQIAGVEGGALKIKLTAPPVEGQANEALLKFLGQVLGVPRSRLDVVAGATGRDKLISVIDMDAADVHKKIVKHLN